MPAPYVSMRRLVGNANSAMLSAIELYNKPQIAYRDETVVVLVTNAWELALKAALRKSGKSVFYPKRAGHPYRSLTLDDALGRVTAQNIWPSQVDGIAASANIRALADFRDRAIHLYNARDLGAVIYVFLQQNVLNYRDFVLDHFGQDLAESISWQLLPLGASLPADAAEYMRADNDATMGRAVLSFIEHLRKVMDETERANGDMARLATVYDVHLRSIRKMSSADLVVAVDPSAKEHVVERRVDPSSSHPYNMKELLRAANKRRSGRDLTSRDYQAVCWKHSMREQSRYAWRHRDDATCVWSGAAVAYLASLSDREYDDARSEYRLHLQSTRSPR